MQRGHAAEMVLSLRRVRFSKKVRGMEGSKRECSWSTRAYSSSAEENALGGQRVRARGWASIYSGVGSRENSARELERRPLGLIVFLEMASD